MERIAVVIPAYDAQATIAATLASVLAQSRPPNEILVVDDGSRDGTAAVVEQFAAADPRIRLIRQVRSGPSAARNRAIAATAAELIAPLDADDLWDPGYLERLGEALAQHPQAGFAFCRHRLIDPAGAVIRDAMPFDLSGGCFGPMLLVNPVGNGSSAVFRRSAILRAGGYAPPSDDWLGAEDYYLQLKMAASSPIACVPETLSSYRVGAHSLSRNETAMRRARLQAVARALDEFGPCPLPVLRWARADADRVLAVASLRRGRFAEALAWGFGALAADPAGTAADFVRRVANACWRALSSRAPRAPRIDPLAQRRASRLHAAFPYGTVPTARPFCSSADARGS
ncbi:MAG: glycosyl transferase family 2 [Novosphingobium sp.]|nr:glycosyl transferase family 2 [Novosphingobium sp.]